MKTSLVGRRIRARGSHQHVFAFALLNVAIRLRPDPLEVSGGLISQQGVGVVTPNLGVAFRTIFGIKMLESL